VKYVAENGETAEITFEKARSTVLSFRRVFAAGKEAFQSRDYNLTLAHLTKANQIVPDDSGTLSLTGWAYYFTGQYEKARELFDKAVAVDSANHNAFRGRGWTFLQKGFYQDAIKDLIISLELADSVQRDNWLETVRGLAWSHYHSGTFTKATEYFQELLSKADRDEMGLLQDVHRGLGWCYYRTGMLSEAGDHFRKAISHMKPGNHELAQDAKRGLEMIASGVAQPVIERTGDVYLLSDLPATARDNWLFAWGKARARSFKAALKAAVKRNFNF
jgi:tetratricopeptide (TPR) repeat protein